MEGTIENLHNKEDCHSADQEVAKHQHDRLQVVADANHSLNCIKARENDSEASSVERTSENVSEASLSSSSIHRKAKNRDKSSSHLGDLPPRQGSKRDDSKVRKGKWTAEEEEYTSRIIHYFNSGLLTLPDGATLRSYLAEKLNCDPMRITKKYAGASCLGRRIQHFRDRTQPSMAEVQLAKAELDLLEQRFRLRVEEGCTGIPLPKPDLMAPLAAASAPGMMLSNVSASPASSAFQSWLLSLAGGNPAASLSAFQAPAPTPVSNISSSNIPAWLLSNALNTPLSNQLSVQAESAIASLAFAQAAATLRAAASVPQAPDFSSLLLQNLQKAAPAPHVPRQPPKPSPPPPPPPTARVVPPPLPTPALAGNADAYVEQLKSAYQEHCKSQNIQVEESPKVIPIPENEKNPVDVAKRQHHNHATADRPMPAYPDERKSDSSLLNLEFPRNHLHSQMPQESSLAIAPPTVDQVLASLASSQSTRISKRQTISEPFPPDPVSKPRAHDGPPPTVFDKSLIANALKAMATKGEEGSVHPSAGFEQTLIANALKAITEQGNKNDSSAAPAQTNSVNLKVCHGESLKTRTDEEKAAGNILLGFLSTLRDSYEEALRCKDDSAISKSQAPPGQVRKSGAQSLRNTSHTSGIRFEERPQPANVTDSSPSPPQSSLEDSEDWNSDKKTDQESSEDSDKDDKEAPNASFNSAAIHTNNINSSSSNVSQNKRNPSENIDESRYNADKGSQRAHSKGPPRKRLKAARAMSDASMQAND
jgi:hypothetical protein